MEDLWTPNIRECASAGTTSRAACPSSASINIMPAGKHEHKSTLTEAKNWRLCEEEQ
jgi:hypothetical protein